MTFGEGRKGFTLLEVIIALTILALMAGVVFSSLRLSLNSYDKSQQRIEDAARKRVLFDQLKRQIGSLFPLLPHIQLEDLSQIQEGMPVLNENFNNPGGNLNLGATPLFYGDPESVTFVTLAPLILQKSPGLTVVRYGLAQDEYGNYYLGAMETPFTGQESFLEMMGDPRGKPLPLVEQVKVLVFEYYGFDPQIQAYSWLPNWRGDEMLQVPNAIRITYNDEYLVVPVNANAFSSGRGGLAGTTVGF